MTTSDLKAAAERLRRLADGESGKVVYGFAKSVDERLDECDYEHITEKKNRDRKICAEAYLATQQQDGGQQPSPDAAITEEWLREIGGCDECGSLTFGDDNGVRQVSVYRGKVYVDKRSLDDCGVMSCNAFLSLLDALGVPTKKDKEVPNG